MQWIFTPDDVVKGEVDYGLEAFRRDLREEVINNLASDDEEFIRHSFDMIYDLCHWIATGREFADFVSTLPENGPLDAHVLSGIKEHMQDNITMLGAILQRMIMDGVEQGLPLEQAIDNTAQQHASIVSETAST
jgi:hypothetical protein